MEYVVINMDEILGIDFDWNRGIRSVILFIFEVRIVWMEI